VVWPQNHSDIFTGLASKPVATVSGGLASKTVVTVSRVGPQNWQLRFSDLSLKITATVSWLGLSVAPQNRRREVNAGHASRSSGLLHVEASLARVFQSGLKADGGVTRVVYVTLSWRLRQGQVEDGRVDVMSCIGPCYSCFAIFIILDSKDIVIF
jgi:hypothetical protein